MTHLGLVELLLCIGLYLHLGHSLLTGTGKQSFATWFLWGVLDAITAGSIYFQHGNFTAVSIYAVSGFVISLCILLTGDVSWGWFETRTAASAAICMIIWAKSGPWLATIAGTIAVAIATWPAIKHASEKPREHSLITWSGFLVVNILSIYQGNAWSVKERFYPVVCTVLCLALLMLTMKKLWISEPVPTKEML